MKKSWHQNFKRASKESRTYKGITFHSLKELTVYKKLELLEMAGEIKNLRRQVPHELILPDGTPIYTPKKRYAKYTSDFEYYDVRSGENVIADVKGYEDKTSALRISVFEAISKNKVKIIK